MVLNTDFDVYSGHASEMMLTQKNILFTCVNWDISEGSRIGQTALGEVPVKGDMCAAFNQRNLVNFLEYFPLPPLCLKKNRITKHQIFFVLPVFWGLFFFFGSLLFSSDMENYCLADTFLGS